MKGGKGKKEGRGRKRTQLDLNRAASSFFSLFLLHGAKDAATQVAWYDQIGMADLKIAAMAGVHDALLLSGNQRDFGRCAGVAL